jgi:hypothetical protein
MIANFREKRSEFDHLLEMVREDEKKVGKRLFRIDYYWTAPENLSDFGISEARVREYRRLFPEIGIPRGFYAYGEGKFYMFVASAQGLGVSGSSKSYVWSEVPPESLVDGDLDEHHRMNRDAKDFIFRPIDGNWYLERDR